MSTNTAAGKTIHNDKVKNLVITAFFTAITFLGIQSFRIPLPAAVGTPFLHFGHIFVVMGLLLQGGKRGAVSGTLGLTIFDMLNGYMQDAPKTFVETALKCLIVEFIMGTISMMIMGSGFAAAAVGAFTSLPATVINAVFMVIAIAVLYQPVKKIYVRMA